MTTFASRLSAAMAERGHVCVGIDPHPALLDAWGLARSAAGVRDFGLRVVEAMSGVVGIVKPQSALFEEYGSAGIAALEDVLAAARAAGLVTILDVKRGDIGSTMAAYARAYLAEGSPLAADAITLSPYLGFGSLAPAIEQADATGRGVFVLALTSNPEGPSVQHARRGKGSVAGEIVEAVGAHNAAMCGKNHLGNVGLVVGATVGDAARDLGLDFASAHAPILAPGIGAQGADAAQVIRVFGEARSQVIASTSRAVLRCGPTVGGLADAAAATVEEIAAVIG